MKYKKYKNCITRTNIYTTQYVAEIHAMQCAKMCNSLWCLVTSCQIYPGIKLRICTALWCLAVGVLSLVAKCVLGISLRCSLMYLFSTTICSAEIHAMQSTCNAEIHAMQCNVQKYAPHSGSRPLVSCHWLPNMLRDPFHNLLFTYILNYMWKFCTKRISFLDLQFFLSDRYPRLHKWYNYMPRKRGTKEWT